MREKNKINPLGFLVAGLCGLFAWASEPDYLAPGHLAEVLHTSQEGIALESLGGGYSGAPLYKVTTTTGAYVLRGLGGGAGQPCSSEFVEINNRAGRAGASPQVVFVSPEYKYIITEWVQGNYSPDGSEISGSLLLNMAKGLRSLHRCAMENLPDASPTKRWSVHLISIISHAYNLPGTFFPHVAAFWRDLCSDQALAVPGLVHTDLHPSNLIVDGDNPKIIDLENCGVGDVYFDLAQFTNTFNLSESQIDAFLKGYFEEGSYHREHFNLLRRAAYLLFACWGFDHGGKAGDPNVSEEERQMTSIEMDRWLSAGAEAQDLVPFILAVHRGDFSLKTPRDRQVYGIANYKMFLLSA